MKYQHQFAASCGPLTWKLGEIRIDPLLIAFVLHLTGCKCLKCEIYVLPGAIPRNKWINSKKKVQSVGLLLQCVNDYSQTGEKVYYIKQNYIPESFSTVHAQATRNVNAKWHTQLLYHIAEATWGGHIESHLIIVAVVDVLHSHNIIREKSVVLLVLAPLFWPHTASSFSTIRLPPSVCLVPMSCVYLMFSDI